MLKQRSFTLIELLVVIAVIGLISSLALLSISPTSQRQKARIAKTLEFSQSIQSALGIEVVGIWNFNDCTANDLSGFKNNGTINGAVCDPNTPQKIIGQDQGKNALSFNGSYVNVSNSPSLAITDKLTIEFWLYQTGYTSGYSDNVVGKGSSASDMTFTLYTGGTDFKNVLLWYANRGGVWGTISDAGKISLNTWTHVVLTYDNGGIQYINGVPGSKTGSGLLASNTFPLRIGMGGQWGYYFKGLIDEVRIYKQALTVGQIQQHYAEGLEKHYDKFSIIP